MKKNNWLDWEMARKAKALSLAMAAVVSVLGMYVVVKAVQVSVLKSKVESELVLMGFAEKAQQEKTLWELRKTVALVSECLEASDGKPIASFCPALVRHEEEGGTPMMLMLGLANAESTLCSNFVKDWEVDSYNCWGFKGVEGTHTRRGSFLQFFQDRDSAVNVVGWAVKRYYLDEGKATPQKMVRKWVGREYKGKNDTWVNNVKKFYE